MSRWRKYQDKVSKRSIKQITAEALVLVMTIGLFAVPSFANIQIPVDSVDVDNVYYIIGENIVTGESMISPTMTVSWEDPDEWAPANDPADIHPPDFYEIDINNITTGKDKTVDISSGSDEYNNKRADVHEFTNLDTGSLYEIKVNPYHYHETDGVLDLAPVSGIPDKAYAITDLQVNFESDDNSITVIWDNLGIPEFQYRIVYAIGDFSGQTKSDLEDNKEGEISGLTLDSDDVTSFYDPISKRNKLSYTITQNVYPGQVYSIMVEPLVEYYSGAPVTRNRNYPVISNVSTNIRLDYAEVGDQLRLQWEIPASFKVGSNNSEYELVETRLVRYLDGQGKNLAILNGQAGAVGYYTVSKPTVETGFQLELTYKAVEDESKPTIEPVSNYLTYSPSLVEVVPTKPIIPEFISQDILDNLRETNTIEQVRDILADKYLVPGSTYTGNLDDLLDQNITYHLDLSDDAINLAWSAFRRIDIDQNSDTYNRYITDLNTYYDITVTNSYNALSYATRFLTDQRFSSMDSSSLIKNEAGGIVGFHMKLDGYYNEETGKLETIRPNQIYYIKVVAKKKIGDEEITSEPTITTIYYTDDGATYVPPLITKPPLRVLEDKSSSESITIGWKESWWAVIDMDALPGEPLGKWVNEVWVEDSGAVSDQEIEGAEYFPVYESADEVNRLISYLASKGSPINLDYRQIDLGSDPFGVSNIYYKFLRINYKDVEEAIKTRQSVDPNFSFLEYFDEMVKADKDGTNPLNWRKIEALVNEDDIEELVFKETGLLPNTSYLFVLYPYRVLYDTVELNAHYPTPIIVATEPIDVVVNPDPTVPSMYVTDKTDRTISLSWQYNTDFEYEILYNTTDNVETAKVHEIILPENSNDPDYPQSGEYYETTIKDLFPDTGYYFFIRSVQPVTLTKSLWSNPVFGVTLDVPVPDPPLGVGIPSDSQMLLYDYDTAVTTDSIAISWLLDVNDTPELNEDLGVKVYYSYILEAANNEKFIGPQYIVSGEDDSVVPDNVEILEKNLVKMNELISNRYYYFRMKTRVTIVGEEADQIIIKESSYYSPTIRILTVASENEYDSTQDPALEILPSENYEIIYDGDSYTLTYRFRDNGVDENGYRDNNVDQRLISDLIKRNLYEYEIDIASYDNKPITTRVVEIPYSIMEAFESYQIEMQIDAGHLLMNIPYDSLMKEISRQKDQYGVAPTLQITISDVDNFYDRSRMPDGALTSVSVPQDLEVKVKSSKVNKTLRFSDTPIEIGLNTSSRYSVYGKNPVVYSSHSASGWDKLSGTYNRSEGAFMVSTRNVGSYGVFLMEGSQEIVSSIPNHWSESYKSQIDDLYTVKGLAGYNPDSPISENEVLNIIYQVVSKQKEINADAPVGSSLLDAMYYAGLKTDTSSGGSTIKREEAIAMMMKAMEIRNNLTLVADINILNQVMANSGVSSDYKTMIAKATTFGLVSDLGQLRPQDKLTYAEFFALWAKAEDM